MEEVEERKKVITTHFYHQLFNLHLHHLIHLHLIHLQVLHWHRRWRDDPSGHCVEKQTKLLGFTIIIQYSAGAEDCMLDCMGRTETDIAQIQPHGILFNFHCLCFRYLCCLFDVSDIIVYLMSQIQLCKPGVLPDTSSPQEQRAECWEGTEERLQNSLVQQIQPFRLISHVEQIQPFRLNSLVEQFQPFVQ